MFILGDEITRLRDELAATKAECARLQSERDGAREDLGGLRTLATGLIAQLTLLTRDDMTYLWKIGGRPLDDAFLALKRELGDDR